jgi:hypothetical protein
MIIPALCPPRGEPTVKKRDVSLFGLLVFWIAILFAALLADIYSHAIGRALAILWCIMGAGMCCLLVFRAWQRLTGRDTL